LIWAWPDLNTGNEGSKSQYKSQFLNSKGIVIEDKRLKFEKGKQRELLESVVQNEFRYLSDFVKFIGFSRRNIFNWRKEKTLLPKSIFDKICLSFPKYKKFKPLILNELPKNWNLDKFRKLNALKMKNTQNKIRLSITSGDTDSLKKQLNLVRKHKKNNGFTEILINQSKPKSLDSSKILFSWKDKVKGIVLPKELSIDLCYVIGAHLGDGSMNIYRRKGQVDYLCSCNGHQINDKYWYDNILVPLKSKLFNLQLVAKNRSDGTYSIQFRSKAVVCFYNEVCSLPLGKKSGITDIPQIILDSGLEYTLACISGVFDTDFCFSFKNSLYGFKLLRGKNWQKAAVIILSFVIYKSEISSICKYRLNGRF